jgi:hypothetical protein
MKSKSSRHRANVRAQAKRWNAMVRLRRRQNLQRKSELWIPTSVLQALAALGLPKDKNIYTARLRELMGS